MIDQAPLTPCTLAKFELPKAFFVDECSEDEINGEDSNYLIYLHIDICDRATLINNQIRAYSDFHLQVADEILHDSWGYSAHIHTYYRYRFVTNFTQGKVKAIKTVVEMVWPDAFKPQLREQSDPHKILLPR